MDNNSILREMFHKLEEIEREQKSVRGKVASLKKELLNTETVLINLSLKHDALKEEIRIWKAQNLKDFESTDKEKDIERFLSILPELDPEAWEILQAQKKKNHE